MSKRTDQVSHLLRQEINNIIIRDFEGPQGILISITEVTISPDLKNATAYVSVIPENRLGTAIEAIQRFGGHVQRELGKKIVLRTIPKIKWVLDERDLKYKKIDEALMQ